MGSLKENIEAGFFDGHICAMQVEHGSPRRVLLQAVFNTL
jgi:hypothetical protein